MFQLRFDKGFSKLTRDIPYWKTEEDIPSKIKDFIIYNSNKRVIYESSTKKFYCSKCLEELDSNNYCKKCDIKHELYNEEELKNNRDVIFVDKIMHSKLCNLYDSFYYFVFDVVDDKVYLYFIVEEIRYYNPALPYKNSKIYVDTSRSYYIEKDGVTNLESDVFTSFKKIYECNHSEYQDDEEGERQWDIYEEFELDDYRGYVYTDNLEELKNTIYKYTKIWELKDYLKTEEYFTISQFTYNPLYYSQFEYLINYQLYSLAWHVPNWFKNGKNFKEIFGVDKMLLPFMVKYNIDSHEFKVLQLYPIEDINVISFFSGTSYVGIELLYEMKIDLKKARDCLINNGLSKSYVSDYLDYIDMVKELRLDITDKNILYPKNLREAHDEVFNQIEVVKDPVIDKKIRNLSYMLALNKYEDEEYVIYPPSSIEELVDESRQQKNCVRTYCERISNNESQVYFMRKKSALDKSLVTVEVYANKIVQARVKYNELPSEELKTILDKWESKLIPITNG